MTENKPIMIDGVDVSACERHYMDNYNTQNRCYSDMTESYSDYRPKENQCNFYITSIEKQLARKTQECERWKSNFNGKVSAIEELLKQLEEKEQECERLKSQLTSLSYADEICALEIDLNHKTQECEELKTKNEKLKEELLDLQLQIEEEQLRYEI